MSFVNESGVIANWLSLGSQNLTGDLFSTILLILLLLVVLAAAFRISLEYMVLFFTPMLLVLMAYYSEWYAIGGMFVIILAVLFARNFFVQS